MTQHRYLAIASVVLACTGVDGDAACTSEALCGPTDDPCVVEGPCAVDPVHHDLGNRALVLASSARLEPAREHTLSIAAGSIEMQPGAQIVAPDSPEAQVELYARTGFTMASAGQAVATIDVSGRYGLGLINIRAGGPVVLRGDLVARATASYGVGGDIYVLGSSLTLEGRGITATGAYEGEGGLVSLEADGLIEINAPINVSQGSAGTISIATQGNLVIGPRGVLEANAGGLYGDGGQVSLESDGDIVVDAPIRARGSGQADDAGDGGEIDVHALGSIRINRLLDASGPAAGTGGVIMLEAGRDLTQRGLLLATGADYGGYVTIMAGGDTAIGSIAARGRNAGGNVEIVGRGVVSLLGSISTSGRSGDSSAGYVDIDGCHVILSGTLRNQGAYSFSYYNITNVRARDLTVSGMVRTNTANTFAMQRQGTFTPTSRVITDSRFTNQLRWQDAPPAIMPGAAFAPSPTISQAPVSVSCNN